MLFAVKTQQGVGHLGDRKYILMLRYPCEELDWKLHYMSKLHTKVQAIIVTITI